MDILKMTEASVAIKDKWKIFIIAVMVVFLASIGSRSWIGVVFFFGLTITLTNRKMASLRLRRTFIAIFIGFLILIVSLPVTRERFEGLITPKFEFSEYRIDRLVIWSTALNYIHDNPRIFLFGNGTGSSNQSMDDAYNKLGIEWDFEQKNNTHNQYLNFLLNHGIIGLTILLAYLIFPLLSFRKSGNLLGVAMILVFMYGLVFENYLDRQKGVIFVSLLYSMLYFTQSDKKIVNNNKTILP